MKSYLFKGLVITLLAANTTIMNAIPNKTRPFNRAATCSDLPISSKTNQNTTTDRQIGQQHINQMVNVTPAQRLQQNNVLDTSVSESFAPAAIAMLQKVLLAAYDRIPVTKLAAWFLSNMTSQEASIAYSLKQQISAECDRNVDQKQNISLAHPDAIKLANSAQDIAIEILVTILKIQPQQAKEVWQSYVKKGQDNNITVTVSPKFIPMITKFIEHQACISAIKKVLNSFEELFVANVPADIRKSLEQLRECLVPHLVAQC